VEGNICDQRGTVPSQLAYNLLCKTHLGLGVLDLARDNEHSFEI
jgi:hypothetical protein